MIPLAMIPLVRSTFFHEQETKRQLCDFITGADRLSMGSQCAAFEEAFAEKQGCAHAVFVSSGSSANLVLIQALLNQGRLKKNQTVGVSALTWATNVMPIMQLGLKPFIIDCELETLNVSPRTLDPSIKQLNALFITHTLGLCDDLEAIQAISKQHNVLLLEDNCEGLGSKFNATRLGNFGHASTFSFFVGHHMSTIEGGMVCTNDTELYEMLVMTRAHGWSRNLSSESKGRLRAQHNIDPFYDLYTFYVPAYNARPTEIQGFLGTTQLHYWDEIVSKRERNFKRFQAVMAANNDFIPLRCDNMDVISNFAMPVVCKDAETGERYKKRFIDAGVEIRPIIAGNIAEQPFLKAYQSKSKQKDKESGQTASNAAQIHRNGFYFPNNPELTTQEVDLLAHLLVQ